MWQWWAIAGMACFAALQLVFADLNRRGIDVAATLFGTFAAATLLYFAHTRTAGLSLPRNRHDLAAIVVAGVLSYTGNLYSVRALGLAPNPGYAVAVVGLQAAVVTLGAVALLGSPLSWTRAAGVALCAIGVTLLVK